MSIPITIPLEAGGAVIINHVGGKVLMIVPDAGAVLTRAECEHVGDVLWQAGIRAETIGELAGHAQPIKSVSDPRVRGATDCPDAPRAGDCTAPAPQG